MSNDLFPWITHTHTHSFGLPVSQSLMRCGEKAQGLTFPPSLPHQHACSSAQGSLITGQVQEAGVRGSYYEAMH